MLDLRTQEGRYARDICDGIAADLGGKPNAAQQLLCQMFALKLLRVQLLVKTILSGESVNQHTENYCLAWMNSARRDLEALNVLSPPSGVRSLFDIPPSEMTDEQLEEALREWADLTALLSLAEGERLEIGGAGGCCWLNCGGNFSPPYM